jgi:hypothetical protein
MYWIRNGATYPLEAMDQLAVQLVNAGKSEDKAVKQLPYGFLSLLDGQQDERLFMFCLHCAKTACGVTYKDTSENFYFLTQQQLSTGKQWTKSQWKQLHPKLQPPPILTTKETAQIAATHLLSVFEQCPAEVFYNNIFCYLSVHDLAAFSSASKTCYIICTNHPWETIYHQKYVDQEFPPDIITWKQRYSWLQAAQPKIKLPDGSYKEMRVRFI